MRTPWIVIILGAALFIALTAYASSDSDGDGITDDLDNCTIHANPDQEDTDEDGFGNRCDADFNGDCVTGIGDFGFFKSCLDAPGQAVRPRCEDANLNGDNQINVEDHVAFSELFGQEPGPSALAICE